MTRRSHHDVYQIEPLSSSHDRKSFSCGVASLDRYLRQQASQDAKRNFAAVFVAVESSSGSLHGFYSLSMAAANLDLIPEEIARKMPRYPTVPAVRLSRLAVHQDVQRKGLGKHLLIDAMARSQKNEIAWTAFIVEARIDNAREWYRHLGFESFKDHPNHLYLMRKTIEELKLVEVDWYTRHHQRFASSCATMSSTSSRTST